MVVPTVNDAGVAVQRGLAESSSGSEGWKCVLWSASVPQAHEFISRVLFQNGLMWPVKK